MFCFNKIRKPTKNTIFMKHNKSSWCVVVTSLFLLLSLSLFSHHYFSSYKNTITRGGTVFTKIASKSVKEDVCLGRYIYMYDLPDRFNKELVKNCRAIAQNFDYCTYTVNGGFGPKFSDISDDSETFTTKDSWYETNQFMLSMIFHDRMKKYECLTKNASLAKAIYAPFYAGLEIRRYLRVRNLTLRDEGAVAFTSWIRDRPEWKRALGWDHFFVTGRLNWDFRRLSYPTSDWGSKLISYTKFDWGSKLINLPEGKNMTMLTIESSPFGNSDFAIPYPTYFHPEKDADIFEWQNRVRNAKRQYLFSFGGAPRPDSSGSIRERLINQCIHAKNHRCNLVICKKGDDMCTKPSHFVKMYLQTDFCLQPPGDSSTRRSTFDSILSGCIPVFFHPGSAYVQYIWHLPKDYRKYSVFIPTGGIEDGTVSVEEVLLKYSADDISAMREELIRLIPRIVYARNKLETIEDAFDISIKKILERVDKNTRMVQEGKDPYGGFPEYASWKYYMTGGVGKHGWDSYF